MPQDGEDLDGRLLRALQRQARASYLELAGELEVSRTLVAARLTHLIDSGALRVVAAVDPALLGQHVLAHVSVEVIGAAEPTARWLCQFPEVVLVSAVSGQYGVIAEVRVGSNADLTDVLARIRAHSAVGSIETRTYTRVLRGLFFPQRRTPVAVDDVDRALINLLQADGRATYRALAQEVELSPTATRSRVQRMLDAQVIKISAVEIRGSHGRQSSMGLSLDLAGVESALVDHIASSPHVEFAAHTVGAGDLIATVAAPTPAELLRQIDQFRELDGVRRVRCWSHLRLFKEDYARRVW